MSHEVQDMHVADGQLLDRNGPAHHPGEEFLLAYASGALAGPKALLAATHLAFCPQCRRAVAAAESLGGAILDGLDGEAVAMTALSDVSAVEASPKIAEAKADIPLPRPLRDVLTSDTPGEGWRNIWFGVREFAIPGFSPSARLLWIPAGRKMPQHDHYGEEWTMVLRGSYSDTTGRYMAGDVQLGEPGLDHEPHAGREGPCLCLVVEDSGLRLSGWWGRWVAWVRAPKAAGAGL